MIEAFSAADGTRTEAQPVLTDGSFFLSLIWNQIGMTFREIHELIGSQLSGGIIDISSSSSGDGSSSLPKPLFRASLISCEVALVSSRWAVSPHAVLPAPSMPKFIQVVLERHRRNMRRWSGRGVGSFDISAWRSKASSGVMVWVRDPCLSAHLCWWDEKKKLKRLETHHTPSSFS
jgi:hypothetical protein